MPNKNHTPVFESDNNLIFRNNWWPRDRGLNLTDVSSAPWRNCFKDDVNNSDVYCHGLDISRDFIVRGLCRQYPLANYRQTPQPWDTPKTCATSTGFRNTPRQLRLASTLAFSAKQVNPSLAKPQFKFNGCLAKLLLTSLEKNMSQLFSDLWRVPDDNVHYHHCKIEST